MTLAQHLSALYPTADRSVDFLIQDDGEGPFLSYWNEALLGPKPDIANLPPAPTPTPPDPLGTWDVITLKIAFAHENRLRALEGKTAVLGPQFKTAVRSLL